MKFIALLLLTALLCGCVTERERSRRNSAEFNAWLDAIEQTMREEGVP